MNALLTRLPGGDGHKYRLIGGRNATSTSNAQLWNRKHSALLIVLVALAGLTAVFISGSYDLPANDGTCDTISHGYQCQPEISHFWGQYSPYFSVPSEISPRIADDCSITFAQILSRHGARDPTLRKSETYNRTIQKLKQNVKDFSGKYAFLADYEYTLGADQLTTFGRQELVNSGIKFYNRYVQLTRETVPFVRASGQKRVVESAEFWNEGFTATKMADENAHHGDGAYPTIDLIPPEQHGMNNTLSHDLCTNFRNHTENSLRYDSKRKWGTVFLPPIQRRLNSDLPGANLSLYETAQIMDLCPFNVVASTEGQVSSFCSLFSEEEWHQYNYYETLDKWYGNSFGNPLGPTQGVGFVNELIARMIDKPVKDHTSTNHTLDDDQETFPLGRKLYADFSHDNDMTGIFSALGLFNGTSQLPMDDIVEADDCDGFSAAWVVPFAARAYFEKMKCEDHNQELVRVIVNDRVLPLTQCGGDDLGRCSLANFIDSLTFAKSGGYWDQCFE